MERKRPRKLRHRKPRRFLPDPDEIPQIADDADVPDICLGGPPK
jgi:hypothetical protein